MTETNDLISSGRKIRRSVDNLKTEIINKEKLFTTLLGEFSEIISKQIIFEKPECEPFMLADYNGDNSPACTTMGEAICHTLAKISFRSFESESKKEGEGCKKTGDIFTSNFIQTDWLKLYGQGKDFYFFQTLVFEIGIIFTRNYLPEKSKIDITLNKIGGAYSLDYTWVL